MTRTALQGLTDDLFSHLFIPAKNASHVLLYRSRTNGGGEVKSESTAISPQEFLSRQEICRQKAREKGVAGLLVVGGPFYDRPGDLAYLTGHYPPFPSVNFQGDYRGLGFGVFLLPVNGRSILISDTAAYRSERVVADEVRPTRNLPAVVRGALMEMKLNASQLGLVGSQVAPWALVNEMVGGAGIQIADEILRPLRRRKSSTEVSLLRRAAEVAEIGMAAALAAVAPGNTESRVCAEGIKGGLAAGADFVRYLRVLSGPFAGWPHRWPPATNRILQEGETACLDYIGAVDGYQFDILRSAVVGQTNLKADRMLRTAFDATMAAITACGPSVPVAEVIKAADTILDQGGFLQHRAKFTGHGIGLDTVEAPLLMEESDEVLQPGDVICLEPGILIRDVGGARFEYEVVITEGGNEVLSLPKNQL
jgi:Xaa-Pro aminopeptidase